MRLEKIACVAGFESAQSAVAAHSRGSRVGLRRRQVSKLMKELRSAKLQPLPQVARSSPPFQAQRLRAAPLVPSR